MVGATHHQSARSGASGWSVFNIDDAALETYDPNSVLVSSSQSGDTITLEILGGLQTKYHHQGVNLLLPLFDTAGVRCAGRDCIGVMSSLEVVAGPGNGTDLWCVVGIVNGNDPALDNKAAGGINYNSANPAGQGSLDAGWLGTAASASGTHAECAIAKGSRGCVTNTNLIDSTWQNISNLRQGNDVYWPADDMYWCLSAGRDTALAGNVTIQVKARLSAIVKRSAGSAP